MEFKNNYSQKELEKYNCTLKTVEMKETLANVGIDWLIEGLDNKKITSLRKNLTKKTRRGQLKFGDAHEIVTQDNHFPDSLGYTLFNIALKDNPDVNLIVTRTSGLFGNQDGFISERFLLQGDTYKI